MPGRYDNENIYSKLLIIIERWSSLEEISLDLILLTHRRMLPDPVISFANFRNNNPLQNIHRYEIHSTAVQHYGEYQAL